MKIGYIGLGKMGHNMVVRLLKKKHQVVAFDVNKEARDGIRRVGAKTSESVKELVWSVPAPRLIWLMVPHKVVDKVLDEVMEYVKPGDIIIDGGNSYYEDSMVRAKKVMKKGVRYMDIGTSGGPGGALNGACLMVGGDEKDYEKLIPLFKELSVENGYGYMGPHGAGHFVKMVHNGIEYGMMQALAEGFAIMKKSKLHPRLKAVTELYNRGSVVESRLVGWLKSAYEHFGEDLKDISGVVGHTGEGEWTIKTAKKLGIPAKVIEESFRFRVKSKKNPSYTGQVLSALRNEFGGHAAKK